MVDIIITNHCQILGYSLCQYFCLLCIVDPHQVKGDTLLIIIIIIIIKMMIIIVLILFFYSESTGRY